MKIKCPACSKVLTVPDAAAGKVIKCPCGKQLRAPGGAAPAGAAANPAARRPAAQPTAARPATRRPAATGGMGDFDAGMLDELTDNDLGPVKAVNQPGRPKPAPSGGSALLNQHASTRDARGDALLGPAIKFNIAGPGRRIVGVLVDGLFHMFFFAIGLGILFAMGPGPDGGENGLSFYIFIGMMLIPAIINAVLISMSGQTVGKKVVGTQIVSELTGAPAGFTQGFLIRQVGFGFFTGIPILGALLAIADCIYLFSEDRRTLHDKWANTSVARI
ncbi:MAG: RDD family protein [Rubripirellula sp.]